MKHSVRKFRPDFHVQLNKSLDKYTFREYMLGCLFLAEALVANGRPIAGYLSYLRFISWKSTVSRAYQTQALIKYDQHVSIKVIRGLLHDWVLSEEEAVCLYLGVDGMLVYKQLIAGSRSAKGALRSYFANYPSDICWLFNYRSCEPDLCKRKHVCMCARPTTGAKRVSQVHRLLRRKARIKQSRNEF